MKRFELQTDIFCGILDTKDDKFVAMWRKEYNDRTNKWEFSKDVVTMSENLVKLLNELAEGK